MEVRSGKKLRCKRIGCDAKFTDDDNPDGSCQFHASRPCVHDGMNEWSCCKQRSHDFRLFLEIPGCKTGKHTTEKPVLAKPAPTHPVTVPTSSPDANAASKSSCSRCRQGFFCSDHDKRKSEDQIGALMPTKKHKGEDSEKEDCIDPKEVELSSIKAVVDTIKENVESLKGDVDSLKDSMDYVKAKLNSLQVFKDSSSKIPYSPSSSDDSSTNEYYVRDALIGSGLDPAIDKSAIDAFFKPVGPVVEVKFDRTNEGKYGIKAFIKFASSKEATNALKLHGETCFGHPIYLRRAANDLYTTSVTGFDTSRPENEIKLQLIELFSSVGDIQGIYLTKDSGGLSGYAYINMIEDPAKIGTPIPKTMGGRKLTVEKTNLRKAGKVEMRKNRVDPSMKPKSRKTVFEYNSGDE